MKHGRDNHSRASLCRAGLTQRGVARRDRSRGKLPNFAQQLRPSREQPRDRQRKRGDELAIHRRTGRTRSTKLGAISSICLPAHEGQMRVLQENGTNVRFRYSLHWSNMKPLRGQSLEEATQFPLDAGGKGNPTLSMLCWPRSHKKGSSSSANRQQPDRALPRRVLGR